MRQAIRINGQWALRQRPIMHDRKRMLAIRRERRLGKAAAIGQPVTPIMALTELPEYLKPKSDLVKAVAAEKGLNVVDVPVSEVSADSLYGLPEVTND